MAALCGCLFSAMSWSTAAVVSDALRWAVAEGMLRIVTDGMKKANRDNARLAGSVVKPV